MKRFDNSRMDNVNAFALYEVIKIKKCDYKKLLRNNRFLNSKIKKKQQQQQSSLERKS